MCIEPLGVSIHPSVYLLFDTHPRIYLNAKSWGFREQIQAFRQNVIPDETQVFWDHAPMSTDSDLTAIRILICGNAGVGKSTLLNKIFGLPLVGLNAAHRRTWFNILPVYRHKNRNAPTVFTISRKFSHPMLTQDFLSMIPAGFKQVTRQRLKRSNHSCVAEPPLQIYVNGSMRFGK
jgi:hypothetical protein